MKLFVGYSKAPEQLQGSARPICQSHTMMNMGCEPATIRIAAYRSSPRYALHHGRRHKKWCSVSPSCYTYVHHLLWSQHISIRFGHTSVVKRYRMVKLQNTIFSHFQLFMHYVPIQSRGKNSSMHPLPPLTVGLLFNQGWREDVLLSDWS